MSARATSKVLAIALLLAGAGPEARAGEPEHFVQANEILAGWEARNLAPMRHQSYWAATLIIAICALGLLATAGKKADGSGTLDARAGGGGVRRVAIAAGLLVPVLTAVSQTVFDADYKTLRKAIGRADDIIEEIHVELFSQRYRTFESEIFHQQWWDRFELRMKELVATRKLLRDRAWAPTPETLLPVAHAQGAPQKPAWVLDPPRGEHDLSFVGTGQDGDPQRAREASLEAAREAARLFLAGVLEPHVSNDPGTRGRLVERLVRTGRVADGFLEHANGDYRHYTLLALDRDELEVVLQVASSRAGTRARASAQVALEKAGR